MVQRGGALPVADGFTITGADRHANQIDRSRVCRAFFLYFCIFMVLEGFILYENTTKREKEGKKILIFL